MPVRLGAGLPLQPVGRTAGQQRATGSICRRKPPSRPSWDSTPSTSSDAPLVNAAGGPIREPGEISSAEIPDRAPAAALQRQRLPGVRADRGRGDRRHADHRDDRRRRADSLRARAHRDARAPARKGRTAFRDGSSIEAGALQHLRRRRMGAARHRSRSALLGHRRSVRLHARRSPARPRLRDLRRRRSQDRPGGRDTGSASPASSSASSICCRRLRSRIDGPGRSSKPTTACPTSARPPSGSTPPRDSPATA